MIVAVALTTALISGGFGMSIGPTHVTGPQHSQAVFTVTDVGTTAMHVRAQVIELRPAVQDGRNTTIPYGEYDHATIDHERFILQPGKSERVKVTVNSPDGLAHNLALNLTSVDSGHVSNGASVSTSLGARFDIAGKANPYASPVTLPDATVGHGLPLVPIGALAGLCVLLLAVWAVLRRRRHREVSYIS